MQSPRQGAPPLGDDLLWRNWTRPAAAPNEPAGRGALFLDRDGVVVEERHYLRDPEEVRLERGAVALIQAARARDLAVIVVTNQAGIAKGRFGWGEFAAVEARIAELLAASGAVIDGALACPFHPHGAPPLAHPNHPWRKPNPGMIAEACGYLALDPTRCLLVGDTDSDIAAAMRAGLFGAVHVLTGHGRETRAAVDALDTPSEFRLFHAPDPGGAVAALEMLGRDER